MLPLMMSETFAQNDGFFNETIESRASNSTGFSFNMMSLSGSDGFSFSQLGNNDGFYFNDISGGDGLGFNDLELFSENVSLGGGMLLLTCSGLMYLQIRRNKKENKN